VQIKSFCRLRPSKTETTQCSDEGPFTRAAATAATAVESAAVAVAVTPKPKARERFIRSLS